MASSLRAKLNAIRSERPASPAPRQGGLMRFTHSQSMPEGLYRPSSEALRRIGGDGRAFDIEKCLFLDTETTGLSGGAGTVAFLVGLGTVRGGEMTVEQFFMRDYADEPELLQNVRDRMQRADCVVTFNGRTFDLPLLKTRFIMNRMGLFPDFSDLDLVTPARRAWKMRLENCKLSVLEERILGIRREGDLPGSEVPKRYFAYLKSGELNLVSDIIRHNRQDIFSLGLLLDRLLAVYAAPEKQEDVRDLFSLGKALERMGERAQARRLYRLSAVPRRALSAAALRGNIVAGQANQRLVRLCLRAGDPEAAAETLAQMIARKQMGIEPYVTMAKVQEHQMRRPDRALEYTRAALALCKEEEAADLRKREARLLKKIEQSVGKSERRPKWD